MKNYFVRVAFLVNGTIIDKSIDDATHIGFSNTHGTQTVLIEEFIKSKPSVSTYNLIHGDKDFLEISRSVNVAYLFFEVKS